MSKLDFSTVLRDLHGDAIREPAVDKAKGRIKTQPALDDKGREILMPSGDRLMPVHENVMEDITAQKVALAALTAASIKGEKVDGAEQIKRADIALRVLHGDTLSKADQGLLETLVKDLEFGTELKYAFSRFINDKPQVGEQERASAPVKPAARAGGKQPNGDARPSA